MWSVEKYSQKIPEFNESLVELNVTHDTTSLFLHLTFWFQSVSPLCVVYSCEWNMREAVSQKIYHSKYWLCDAALNSFCLCWRSVPWNWGQMPKSWLLMVSVVFQWSSWPLPLTSTPVKSSSDPTWLYFFCLTWQCGFIKEIGEKENLSGTANLVD